MILIVSSLKDIASLNIKEQILNYYPFKEISETFQQNPIYTADIKSDSVKLVTLKEELVQAQHLPDSFPTSRLIVFISRHSSQSGKPTLSVHTPGNFAEAGLGGLPKTLSVSPATAMRNALLTLEHYKKTLSLNYEVSYECTHHGPSFSVPAMFVELGSSEPQWCDTFAAQAVAHAAMAAVTNFSSTAESAVIGIGGPHYNQKFTQITLTGEAVFGHMIPKYALANIDAEMLSQCVERTLERVSLAILDWKGIKSEDKAVVLSALQDVGLNFKKV